MIIKVILHWVFTVLLVKDTKMRNVGQNKIINLKKIYETRFLMLKNGDIISDY